MTTTSTRIFVAGHRGMVGSAIVRALQAQGQHQIVTATRQELDLCDAHAVRAFFERVRPQQVYLAAARVGGIHANNVYPAEFIYANLAIQMNVIHEAWRNGTERLLCLGSSCIYPKMAPQPMHEDALLTGKLELTNEPYAVAKIAGIKLCESYNRQYGTDFRSLMPTNLYGPGDNYHPENSHVIPALIQRFHRAKVEGAESVLIWGTGQARREFLYVDDLAQACLHVMGLPRETVESIVSPQNSHINAGTGEDLRISELATLVAEVVGYPGRIDYDTTKPDGTPRKLLDVSTLQRLGWKAAVDLRTGLTRAYAEFAAQPEAARAG